mgnify:CR=1 FL=1
MVMHNHRRWASPGGAKVWVMAAIILGAGVFAASKFGPIYQNKWDLEDKMEELMRRFTTLGEDGILEQLQLYVEKQNLGFDVYDSCEFSGELEIGQAATLTCSYDARVGLPKYEKHRVVAVKKVGKIPATSN